MAKDNSVIAFVKDIYRDEFKWYVVKREIFTRVRLCDSVSKSVFVLILGHF